MPCTRIARTLVALAAMHAVHAGAATAMAYAPSVRATLASEPPTALAPAKADPGPDRKSEPKSDPSLDDLLGLPAQKPTGQPAPPDQGKAELNKQLSAEEAQEEFEQAVALMDQVAQRLADAKDKGLDTQRLQADVIRKLDKLIDNANRNNKGSKSKSKQQQQQDQQQQQQTQKQSSQAQQPSSTTTPQGGAPNVPRRDGSLGSPPAGAAASWGNLPPHVRDALMQGFSDRFSSIYKSMTEDYYKRLAQEQKNAGGSR